MKKLLSLLVFVQFIISIHAQVPTAGLNMYLPFSGDANDASGNGNNGTVTNAVLTTDRFGNVGKAYAFNGNSKISVPDAPTLRPSSMSLSVWVKSQQTSGIAVIAGKSIGNNICDSYTLFVDGSTSGLPFASASCSDAISAVSPILYENRMNDIWKHLVYTFDDANNVVKIYLDGQLMNQATWTGSIAYDATPLKIGAANENGNETFYFNGCIDDVRLYGQALSDAEVVNLYNAESAPPIQCSNIAAGALNFDGIDDQVELGWLDFNLQVFTIEMWLKPGSTQQTYADIIDLNHRTGINWVCQYQGNNTYLFGAQVSGVFFTLNSDEWQHLAMVKEDKTIRVYVNGLLVGSVNHDPPILYDGNQSLRLGAWGGGGRNWKGSMDEVRIWNRVLCENEIQARKDCELSGTESGLLAYYKFNQGFIDCINASETTLLDAKGLHNGTLQNFVLKGEGSNYIAGQVSGTCQTISSSILYTFYKDADGDGFGDPSVTAHSCLLPPTYVTNTLDCDDTKASVKPNATEICGNSIDDNCNGQIDENCGCNLTVSLPACKVVYFGYAPMASVTLMPTVTGASNPTYNWSNNAQTQSITVSPTTTTIFTVTVTNGINCSMTASTTVQSVDVRCGKGKVQVCHDQSAKKTLCISSESVADHLAHGDKLGSCSQMGGCSTVNNSSLVVNNTLNASNQLYKKSVLMYPNPTNDKVNFEFEESIKVGNLKIYNLQGKLILSDVLKEGCITHQVDIRNNKLSNGIYMIQLNIDDALIVEKLIVNN